MMAMLDWQDMCKVKEPSGAGSDLQGSIRPQLDAAIKAMPQMLQLRSKSAARPASATWMQNTKTVSAAAA